MFCGAREATAESAATTEWIHRPWHGVSVVARETVSISVVDVRISGIRIIPLTKITPTRVLLWHPRLASSSWIIPHSVGAHYNQYSCFRSTIMSTTHSWSVGGCGLCLCHHRRPGRVARTIHHRRGPGRRNLGRMVSSCIFSTYRVRNYNNPHYNSATVTTPITASAGISARVR